MKKVEVEDIKRISLDILTDIDSFCLSHNIRYSIAFGTLLGAVRHKGFIPWDDDVDIMMLREDYKRFCDEYTSDRFKVASSEKNENCFVSYGRVYDYKETYSRSRWPWLIPEENIGVWIDIFPIDAVSDDFTVYSQEYRTIQRLFKLQAMARGGQARLSSEYSLRSNLKTLAKKVLFLGGLISPRRYTRKMNEVASKVDYSNSSHCAQLMCSVRSPDLCYYRKSIFDTETELEFEGRFFKAVGAYDEFLTASYGNYMELPPLEKRVRPHHFAKFYFNDR